MSKQMTPARAAQIAAFGAARGWTAGMVTLHARCAGTPGQYIKTFSNGQQLALYAVPGEAAPRKIRAYPCEHFYAEVAA